MIKGSNPRAHHYVPQCWLAGFTEDGNNAARLWQSNLKTGKQWPTTPLNAGHRRDFYRLTDPEKDPVMIEKKLSEIEGTIAPILKRLDNDRRMPDADELGSLIVFMAIQWIRVPAFRPTIQGVTESLMQEHMADALSTPEAWSQVLRQAGIPADSPGSDYQKMREFIESGAYYINADNDWHVKTGFTAAIDVIESLENRFWGISVSEKGDFIASDNPVVLDGPAGQKMGFENAGVVIYPVSRHLVLYGTLSPGESGPMDRLDVARHNTVMMLTASDYVFSHRPDFVWLDENDGCQTDLSLFHQERFV
jgi:Protein of unknown function (DUF4238)